MYDAFISYSHSNDRPIAAALQSLMQTLGKAWWQRRKMRVFRDETTLTATPGLWPTIESALMSSRFLVLLASPQSAASNWVNKEVQTWLDGRGRRLGSETLLIALTDGDLTWNSAKGDFNWIPDRTPLPPALKGKFETEPLWIDLRSYRRHPESASSRNPDFSSRAGKIAARILGIPLEDLLSEELRQQRRALRLAWGAAASVALLALIAAGLGWVAQAARIAAEEQRNLAIRNERLAIEQRNLAAENEKTANQQRAMAENQSRLAETQREIALKNQREATLQRDLAVAQRKQALVAESMTRAEQANRALNVGDAVTAILLAIEGLPDASLPDEVQRERPRVENVEKVLKDAFHSRREIAVLPHTGGVQSAVFSPDGSRILTASDGGALLWSTNGEHLLTLSGHTGAVHSAVFSPDGNRIVTAAHDGTARIWSSDGKQLVTLVHGNGNDPRLVYRAIFSPDAARILTTTRFGSSAHVWTTSGRLVATIEGAKTAVFSADGSRILTTSDKQIDEQMARVWQIDGKSVATLKHTEKVSGAVFSPDGKRILTSSGGYLGEESGYFPGTARLWRSDGALIRSLPMHDFGVEEAVFSPTGDLILIVSGTQAQLWEAETGNRKGSQTVHDGHVNVAMFTPGGERIVTSAASTGMFSSEDFSVRLSTIKYLHALDRLSGHTAEVTSIAFSPDNTRMLTASADGTARLWDIEKDPNVPESSEQKEQEPSGKALLELAKQIVPRCLTPEQRQQFFLRPAPPPWCAILRKWPYPITASSEPK